MKALTLAAAIITPGYLYALLPSVAITYESTVAIALISLLCASLVIAIAALSTVKGSK